MNTRQLAHPILCIAILLFTANCGVLQLREGLQNCKFDVAGFELESYTLSSLEFKVDLGIENPNATDVILDRMDFEVFTDAKRLASGTHEAQVQIPSGLREIVSLRFQTSLRELGTSLMHTLSNMGDVDLRVAGTAYLNSIVGDVGFPFEIIQNLQELQEDGPDKTSFIDLSFAPAR